MPDDIVKKLRYATDRAPNYSFLMLTVNCGKRSLLHTNHLIRFGKKVINQELKPMHG